MIRYICDRCKSDITNMNQNLLMYVKDIEVNEEPVNERLCYYCFQKFLKFLRGDLN